MLPFRYNQLEELQKIVKEHGSRLGVIVMEPIRNDDPKPGFLDGVRKIADETGAVLVIDEITAAFRMNSGGVHLLYGLEPDIAVFAKAIGNGYPMGAVIGRGNIMDAAQKSFISSTNWTERIGPSAALATIKKFTRIDASKHLIKCGKRVQEGWKIAATKTGLSINVGGIYPLSHFNFEKDHLIAKAYFVQLMLEKGFLASNLFYSMFAHRPWHIEAYLEAVENAFGEISKAFSDGSLATRLKGKPASSGFKRLN
jgi:glutamate-1-semialdehyde 2,1-aminomutase